MLEHVFNPTVIFSILVVLGGVVAMLLIVIVGLKRQLANQASTLSSIKLANRDLTRTVSDIANQIEEERAKSLVMAKQFTAYQSELDQLENKQRELEQQDPSTRLYQKAVQLAKDGASVDELVQACDLPQAEALLLVNLHQSN